VFDAGALPPPALPVERARPSRAAVEEAISADEVAYYAKTFGVPQEEARVRLVRQGLAHGVADALRARLGGAITSVWFDNDAGRWVVDATPEVGAAVVSHAFAARHVGEDGFRLRRVAYGQVELENAVAAIGQRLEGQVVRGTAQVGLGRGTVDVLAASGLSEQDRAAIEAEVKSRNAIVDGPPVRLSIAPQRSLLGGGGASCSFPYCDTLLAGASYYNANAGCTNSFYGAITVNGQVNQLMLTAGHCARAMGVGAEVFTGSAYTAWGRTYTASENVGDWGYSYTHVPSPSGLNPGLGRPYGGSIVWNSGTIRKLDFWYSTGPAPVGLTICHQAPATGANYGGQSAATQCGVIDNNNLTSFPFDGYNHANTMRITNTLHCKGDSGGPWTTAAYDTAVGIHTGGFFELNGGQCGSTAVATPVHIPREGYSAYNLVLYGG
jgi:hypothetical protein